MARPVAGEWIDDEFSGLRNLGIDHVVSLLERDESVEPGLGDEGSLCRKYGMGFTSLPIPDRACSDADAAMKLAGSLGRRIDGGDHVVIHCRAGIAIPDTDEQLDWIQAVAGKPPSVEIETPRPARSSLQHRSKHLAVLARRQARAAFEQTSEERRILVAGLGADLVDRQVARFEQSFRFLDV